MPREFLLATNDYNEPKVLEGKDAIAAKLLLLLNTAPGTNPLHLEMGVDLSGRYRYCSEEDVDDLELEIRKQIEIYLPDYSTMINIKCQFNQEGLIDTYIQIDDTVYGFSTDENETKLKLEDLTSTGGDDDLPPDPIDPFDDYAEEEYDPAGAASNTFNTLDDDEYMFETNLKYGERANNIYNSSYNE